MIDKDKMFVVSSIVDDSIKSLVVMYDITIFGDFIKLENYILNTPCIVNTIIITETELPFVNHNMQKLADMLHAPFLRLTGKVIYLIGKDTPKDTVEKFLKDYELDVTVYQDDLNLEFISGVISGANRYTDEEETEIVTYRMRAGEYQQQLLIKKYESDGDVYENDEDNLSEIDPIREPDVQIPDAVELTKVHYIIGENSYDRTLFAWIFAQYLSRTGKTIIVEPDFEYHTLTDMVFKSVVNYVYIDIQEFLDTPEDVIRRVTLSYDNLIVFGIKRKKSYDYNFVLGLITSALDHTVENIIKEGNFKMAPHSYPYIIVSGATAPAVLRTISKLEYDLDPATTKWVGMASKNIGQGNLSTQELRDILTITTEHDKLTSEVFEIHGLNFGGGKELYDLRSFVS